MPSEDKATPATGGGSTHHYNFLELGHELLDKALQSGLELDHLSAQMQGFMIQTGDDSRWQSRSSRISPIVSASWNGKRPNGADSDYNG
jgi:hypothetical protein